MTQDQDAQMCECYQMYSLQREPDIEGFCCKWMELRVWGGEVQNTPWKDDSPVMLVFAGAVSAFVEAHPTLKMLALSFLILIGVMLTAEAIGTPIAKGYIYFAMAFSLAVESLNLRIRAKKKAAQAA